MADKVMPWGEVSLNGGETRVLALGTLSLELQRHARELWIRHGHLDPEGGELLPADPGGDDPEWTRWAMLEGASIHLVPAMPDRSVVVAHERPFNLPPKGEARVFVRIPLHVQIVVRAGRGEFVALDVPTIVLSDTWWGGFTGGELAYWLTTKARSEVGPELFEPHLALCPFQLRNESSEALPIGRFAVRVPYVTLFESGDGIWSDEVRVVYEGTEEGSEIDIGGRPPAEAPEASRLAPPRRRAQKAFRAATFNRLLSVSHLGL